MSKARTEVHLRTFVIKVWLLLVRFSQNSQPIDKCLWTSSVTNCISKLDGKCSKQGKKIMFFHQ